MAYIRQEDALNAINQAVQEKTWSMSDRDVIESIEEYVEALPAADVVEVKHGHWKDRYGNKYDNHLYECSECSNLAPCERYNDELGHTQTRQVLTNCCLYCGAKMDE